MATTTWTDVRVCVDCYTAFHYGVNAVENPDHRWNPERFNEATATGFWSDWHCGENHDNTGFCGQCASHDSGYDTFSTSRCETCKSNAAGARYRLAYDGQ